MLENKSLSPGPLVFPSPKQPTLPKFQIGLEYMDTIKQLVPKNLEVLRESPASWVNKLQLLPLAWVHDAKLAGYMNS